MNTINNQKTTKQRPKKPQEQQIIDQCVEALNKYLSAQRLSDFDRRSKDRGVDAEILLGDAPNQRRLLVEVKNNLSGTSMSHLLNQLELLRINKQGLLICTKYANRNVIDQFKGAGMNLVDSFGNMNIELDNPRVTLHIKGNKGVAAADVKRSRLFQPSGLKMLFTILVKPDAINLPYREIANLSGVSLGSVNWIMRDLREKGFVHKKRNGELSLTERADLFRRWVEAYGEQLRPKIVNRVLKAPKSDINTLSEQLYGVALKNHLKWALTGESAADLLTHHIIPNKLIVFTDKWQPEFERELKWAPSERGNIEILNMFSELVPYVDKDYRYLYPVAHPALVYAELLNNGTDRDREAASILAKNYLLDLVI